MVKSTVAKGSRAKSQVYRGRKRKTSGGLRKKDIVKTKSGRFVSKSKHKAGKKHSWAKAVKQARKNIKAKGFVSLKKSGELYKEARDIYDN